MHILNLFYFSGIALTVAPLTSLNVLRVLEQKSRKKGNHFFFFLKYLLGAAVLFYSHSLAIDTITSETDLIVTCCVEHTRELLGVLQTCPFCVFPRKRGVIWFDISRPLHCPKQIPVSQSLDSGFSSPGSLSSWVRSCKMVQALVFGCQHLKFIHL